MRFFDLTDDAASPVTHDLGDAELIEIPGAFNTRDADHYLAALTIGLPWEQKTVRIAGRTMPTPRLQCWFGDKEAVYGYSGIRLTPLPWSDLLLEIKSRVEQVCDQRFNSMLANYYRDGRDSVSWHSDNEAGLGSEPVIASLSLGAERRFDIKPKRGTVTERRSLQLAHGSLLIMGPTMQHHWLHQIPKTKQETGPRINLTFRLVLPGGQNQPRGRQTAAS
ncbi:MAG: alpha-ketoglutarate-dependent dioxygenase AlkB [Pseudohongiellaceae bacterium]